MRIEAVKSEQELKYASTLSDIAKYARTIQFRQKLDNSLRTLDAFLSHTKNPIISCGGGKDGTAIALLANMLGKDVHYITAEPPNPLPDREQHNNELMRWLGGKWDIVPYNWDVQAVLDGNAKYPDGLKMKVLSDYQREHEIDGVVFGIRAAESRDRTLNLALRGEIYETPQGMRCQPIAKWRAEDSLCLALLLDAPINPVYMKMDGAGNYEQLHDGTWWPHGLEDRSGWIKKYYPDFFDLYEEALKINRGNDNECRY